MKTATKEIVIRYKPHAKQREFHQAVDSHRFTAFIGGIGSGKTKAGIAELLRRALTMSGGLGLVAAPTYPMLRDATERTFWEMCPDDLVIDRNKTEHWVRLINGFELIFRSTEHPDRLRGPNVSLVYLDEAGLMPRDAWLISIGRLREHPDWRFWLTTTPKGLNWVYEVFGKPDRSKTTIKVRSHDNPHLNRTLLRELEEQYVGDFRRQELEGEFVAFEGLVYPMFREDLHVTSGKEQYKYHIGGIDWGYTNPTVVLVAGVDGDGNIHVHYEFYRSHVTLDALIPELKQITAKYGVERYWCDPSEPDHIRALQQAGIPADAADNAIIPGIMDVTSMLEPPNDRPQLTLSPACANTIAELKQYQWMRDKNGKFSKEMPVKVNDHGCDALRYMVRGHRLVCSQAARIEVL